MKLNTVIENPTLKKLIRQVDKGDVLFTQGTSGNSVFLILDGELDLIRRSQNSVFSMGKVGPGQFIGEKALLGNNPFLRMATAVVLSNLVVLELGPTEFAQLEKDNPSVYAALLKTAFRTLVERQNQTEELVSVMREYEPEERFVQWIYRQALQSKEATPQGKVISIQPPLLSFYLNLSETNIISWLGVLASERLICLMTENIFLVPDETKILAFDKTSFRYSKSAA